MDATPIDFGDVRPLSGLGPLMGINAPPSGLTTPLGDTWFAIHEAAALVATIAGVDQGQITAHVQAGLRADLQSAKMKPDGVEDLAEVLRRGVSALLEAHVSGGAPHAASLTLWRDFLVARARVLHTGSDRLPVEIDL